MASTTAETSAASTKVFTTYELLEHIILYLPLRQVLLSQNINKACFDVVQRSSKIRQALFLDHGAPVLEIGDRKSRDITPRQWRDTVSKGVRYPIFNPFVIVRALSGSDYYSFDHAKQTKALGKESVVFLKAILRSQKCSKFVCKRTGSDHAMWNQSRNDMLLTQPPVDSLEVEGSGLETARIGTPNGATHGGLIRLGASTQEGLGQGSYLNMQQGLSIEEYSGLEPVVCWLQDAGNWVELADSVDEVTGYAMLELIRLAANGEKVADDSDELIDDIF